MELAGTKAGVRHVWSKYLQTIVPQLRVRAPARRPLSTLFDACTRVGLAPIPNCQGFPMIPFRRRSVLGPIPQAHAAVSSPPTQSPEIARRAYLTRAGALLGTREPHPRLGTAENERETSPLDRAPGVPGMRTRLLALHPQPTVTTCWLGFSRRIDAPRYRTASLWAEVGTHPSERASSQQMNMGILKLLLSRKACRLLRGPDPMRLGVPERAASWDIQLDREPEELGLLRLGRRR
jgi:hypothetical protein